MKGLVCQGTHNINESRIIRTINNLYKISPFLSPDTVIEGDEVPPEISNCPASANYIVPLGTQSRPVTWTEPSATDDQGGLVQVSRSHQPGDEFSVGATEVVYTFMDPSGNEAVCRFTINVGE